VVTLAESLRPHVRKLKATSPAPEVAVIATDVDVGIEAIARRGATLVKFIERYRKVASLPKVRLVSIGVADLLARLVSVLQASLQQAGVECRLAIDPPDLRISADPELLEQALLNVVVNAIDAVRERPAPQIAISASAANGLVQIEIADTGKGIDASQVDKIFLPFFTTKTEGSGIGLSFVKQVMNAHGGQVEVCANQPAGAVFTLTLPNTPPP
jgi:signal transduction histidine kinase